LGQFIADPGPDQRPEAIVQDTRPGVMDPTIIGDGMNRTTFDLRDYFAIVLRHHRAVTASAAKFSRSPI
jgi:hypothetical protein